jgi:hypothetical protein
MAEDVIPNSVIMPKMGSPLERVIGARTNLSINRNCEDWPVRADAGEDMCDALTPHKATLRRIGWIDQKGRVWTSTPSMLRFDGGSLTPLLIDVRED